VYKLLINDFPDVRRLKLDRWLSLLEVIERLRPKNVLEFGSGISTLLFERCGLSVTSLETDSEFAKYVMDRCNVATRIIVWDNEHFPLEKEKYDFVFVDGEKPRMKQVEIAQEVSDVVVMDDWGRGLQQRGWSTEGCGDLFNDWWRIDDRSTILAVFTRINY
jgi:hypothetical protein